MTKKNDVVDQIIDFECGMMDEVESVQFFSELIKTGLAWSLQGSYGRIAKNLIDNEVLDADGEILIEI